MTKEDTETKYLIKEQLYLPWRHSGRAVFGKIIEKKIEINLLIGTYHFAARGN
jgi:hypothetical protein